MFVDVAKIKFKLIQDVRINLSKLQNTSKIRQKSTNSRNICPTPPNLLIQPLFQQRDCQNAICHYPTTHICTN